MSLSEKDVVISIIVKGTAFSDGESYYVIYKILTSAGLRFRDYEEECYGDDEATYYDCYGLSFEAHLNDCSALTVFSDGFEVIYNPH